MIPKLQIVLKISADFWWLKLVSLLAEIPWYFTVYMHLINSKLI